MIDAFPLSDAQIGMRIRCSTISPDPRREAVAASLEEIAALPGNDQVLLDSLGCMMRFLGRPKDGDTPIISARRKTCAEIGEALRLSEADHQTLKGSCIRMGGFVDAARWFGAQIDAWGNSSDPRHKSMASVAIRELAELEA